MDQEIERRWCKFCMTKTKQELVFLPNMATYKRKRKYKCTICGKTGRLQGHKPSAESAY